MNTENIKSQMRKGILEYCTLLILSKKRAYVSDIIQSLKESRLIVVEGTLYPLLTRLKNAGLLDYEWERISSRSSSKILSFDRDRESVPE